MSWGMIGVRTRDVWGPRVTSWAGVERVTLHGKGVVGTVGSVKGPGGRGTVSNFLGWGGTSGPPG